MGKLNVYTKLQLIQSEIKELIRTEENKFQKYKFFNELQVLKLLRPLLEKYKLTLLLSDDTSQPLIHEKEGKEHFIKYLKKLEIDEADPDYRRGEEKDGMTPEERKSVNDFLQKHEDNGQPLSSYETLEFLGDSVLNFYVSFFVYHQFPNYVEGQMSKLKQLMVQESTLAHLSREIGLGEYLQLGTGERKNQGADKESILADVFESFTAALYLEKGGKTVQRFLNLTIFTWVVGKENMIWDHKSQLQEYCQARKNRVVYRLKRALRIGHQQLFIMEVSDEQGTFRESGQGRSKKEAEQQAAAKVIEKLGIGEKPNH
ncbi:19226_t:CDS:2 [Racocetra fulgida]|uniref:ribonuclease III n=1 Tax=Racocetra fulgida TaxID=60492 RepID=A0A9N8YRP6_9GLOM|nr:19226_t:CDS:2 [Racocetra fulgida]